MIHEPTEYTLTNGDVIMAVSPSEFIRRANARESRKRRTSDLSHFIAFLRFRLADQALNDAPNSELDAIVDDYLGHKEESHQ